MNTAEPKLEKAKFCSPTRIDVNFNIIPLIIKLNNPNVNSVIGSDKMWSTGLTIKLRKDNTTLATIAITKLLT